MTKTVFENSMVAHVWAQQTQAHGKSNNGQFYFDGRCIYSYGSHFLAGFVVDENTVLINANGYSVTTSKHMSYVRRAVYGKYPNIYDVHNIQDWRDAVLYDRPDQLARQGFKMNVEALTTLFGRDKARQLINKRDALEKTKYAAERKAFRAEIMRDLKAVKSGYRGDRLFGVYVSVSRHSSYTSHYIALTEAQNCLKATTAAQRKASSTEYNYPSLEAQLKALASKLRAKVKQRKAEFVKAQWQGDLKRLFGYIRALREDPINATHPQTVRTLAYDIGVWTKPHFAKLQDELMRVDAVLAKRQRMAGLKLWKSEMRKVLAFTANPVAYMTRTPNGPTRYVPGFPSNPFKMRQFEHNSNRFAFEGKAYEAYQTAKLNYEAERVAHLKAEWLAGNASLATNLVHPRGYEFAFLRVRGNNVETSRGASVPLDHALRLYRFMKAIKQPWEGDRNAPVRVGHFTLEYVKDDVAKIGCHKLHFDDIEAAYKTYQAMVTA